MMAERPAALHVVSWLQELLPEHPQAAQSVQQSIHDNPLRIDRAYAELLDGYATDPATVLTYVTDAGPEEFPGTVATSDIPFISFCAHHFLPFIGTVSITYRPGEKILGLGKIPRLVRCRSRRFQLQEFLTKELAEDMMEFGRAAGVRVSATATHLCICYRGPDEAPVRNETTYQLGSVTW
jgi:GTP cyclohydrolase IA